MNISLALNMIIDERSKKYEKITFKVKTFSKDMLLAKDSTASLHRDLKEQMSTHNLSN